MKTRQLFLFLAACSALTGCGQPGPLYLPGTTPPIHVEPKPEPEPEPEAEAEPKPEKNK
ncbi:MAG: lipoprotein [Methylococcaceae bacterium]|nr:lipoprotein [Methylococcaceae bacterium]MDD1643547.1 lipoprotein [Methylococcaceae bacterium]